MRAVSLMLVVSTAWAAPQFKLAPATVSPGQVSLLRIHPGDEIALASDLSVGARQTVVPLWDCPDEKGARCGMISVPMETKSALPVTISWTQSGDPKTQFILLGIVQKKYSKTKLRVDPSRVKPSEADEKRALDERKEIMAAYEHPSPSPLWLGGFVLPTTGSITSPFANQRVFNGNVKSTHYGVDLRAGPKNPIYASNGGKVALAKEFFYGGNMVVLDHGADIFSSYAHLSKIDVKPGQIVKKGERLGFAGSTGRVTGPHLHWAVRVNSLAVDPHQFRKVMPDGP